MKKTLCAALLILGCAVSTSSMAQHYHRGGWGGGARFGISIGIPIGGYGYGGYGGYRGYYGPAYGYAPYYAAPVYVAPAPVYVTPPAPPVYVQKPADAYNSTATAAPPEEHYYCSNPKGFYPTIPRCPSGWSKIEVPVR